MVATAMGYVTCAHVGSLGICGFWNVLCFWVCCKASMGTSVWCFYFRAMSLLLGNRNIAVLLETLVLEGNTNLDSHGRKAALQQSAKVA